MTLSDRMLIKLNDMAETRPWLMRWLRRMWWDLP
jgi:hypothetical protein